MVDDPRENPEAAAIDAGWDLDNAGEEPAPSTVAVESLELLARAGMAPARPPDVTVPAPPMPPPRSQKLTPVPGTVPPVTEASVTDVAPPKKPPRPGPPVSARPPVSAQPTSAAPPGRLPLRPPPGTPSKAPETERNAPAPAKPPQTTRPTARAMPKAAALKQASRSDKPAPMKGGLRRPTLRKLTPLVKDSAERAKRLDQRATLPPPVPSSEYVSRMMGQLEGDRPPPTVPSADDSTPLIEVVEEMLQGIDPELLRDTPAPGEVDLAATEELPAADARALLKKAEKLAELDDLPVDTILGDMTQRADRATPVPVGDDLSLELSTSEPPVASAISDFPLDGRGLTGPPGHRPLGAVVEELDPILQPVEERFSVGDYSGALVLAEGLLEEHHEHAQLSRYVESCQDMLRQMYMSRLGDGSDIPRVAMAPDQLRWLTLDHRAGFLLSCIDGSCSIDEVLDVATMPPLEALRTLYEMVQEGVVEISPSSGRR